MTKKRGVKTRSDTRPIYHSPPLHVARRTPHAARCYNAAMEQDLSEFRPSRIWKRMSSELRQQAARVFWSDEQSNDQQIEAVGAISGAMKFRPKSVIALPLERKAKY